MISEFRSIFPNPLEEDRMKFIGFYETLDPLKSIKIFEKISKMKKEDYEKAGLKPVKFLSPPYAFSNGKKGFQLFEAETLEPLFALASMYYGAVKFKFKAYEETQKAIETKLKVVKSFE